MRTERLTLRPFIAADFDDLYAIRSRPDVTRYLYDEPESPAQVRDVLKRKIGESTVDDAGQGISLAVVWPRIDRVIGEVHLQWLNREHRQGEIGFVINPDHHGNHFIHDEFFKGEWSDQLVYAILDTEWHPRHPD